MSPDILEMISEITTRSGRPIPPRCCCFIKLYEECAAGNFDVCKSADMKELMMIIVDLATYHTEYEVEPGEYPTTLIRDIGEVTLNAIVYGDDVVVAVRQFLKAAATHPSCLQ